MCISSSFRIACLVVLALDTIFTFAAYCPPPSPAFFPPKLSGKHESFVGDLASRLNTSIASLWSDESYDRTTVSFLVTDSEETLFSLHYSPRVRSDRYHGGAPVTDHLTNFRIASITKSFTVLALFQLQEAGKLNLDDSVLKYIPSLNGSSSHNSLPWKDITIRSLASQQAGLSQDFAQSDWLNYPPEAALLGLPRLKPEDLVNATIPFCDEFANYTRACNTTQFLKFLGSPQLRPTFAPNQHPTYSNIGFDVLGLVIEAVSNNTYVDYVTTNILKEIGMTHGSNFSTPDDSVAAIPAGNENYWSFEIGVQNPTGGLYSNAKDLGIWLRYVLGSFNAHAHGALNWFGPAAYSGGVTNFYGLPWEILRVKTNEVSQILESERALTIVSKGGGLPGYSTEIVMIPEFGIGLTILVAGNGTILKKIWDLAITGIVELAEQVVLQEMSKKYAGTYDDGTGNSSMVLAVSEEDGLHVESLTMNTVDVVKGLTQIYASDGSELRLNVAPLQLYIKEKEQKGERWRVLNRKIKPEGAKVWTQDRLCVESWEIGLHGGEIVNEIVFWEGDGKNEMQVELLGYRKTLTRRKSDNGGYRKIADAKEQTVLQG